MGIASVFIDPVQLLATYSGYRLCGTSNNYL